MQETKPRRRWLGPVLGALVAVGLALGYFWMLAPELDLPSVGPGSVKLSSFRGQAILLVFFMSDCHICKSEILEVERIHRAYRLRDFLVVGVSVDADYATTQRFINERSLSFGLLRDPHGEKILAAYGSYRMPEAYLIDAQGVVRAVWLGSVKWKSPEVRRQIEEVLPKK